MSGHNKWTQIKRKKEVTDKKRGQIFSKILRAISVTAKEDPNPNYNPRLKAMIDKAREHNVPQENIERAIKKSSLVKDVEDLIMEAYGPEGVAILIKTQTDNRNRAVSEIKKILSDHGAKWADPGSVVWVFEKSGDDYQTKFPQTISQTATDKLLDLLEALDDHDDVIDVYTSANL